MSTPSFNFQQQGFPPQGYQNGDPGPSSLAQQQQQFRPQQGQQGQSPNTNMNPQQIALLQQMAQSRGPNGQSQWTPQQLHAAMQAMQSGGQGNPQTVIQAAMRAGGQGQGQQQPMQGQGQGQMRPGMMMPQQQQQQQQHQQQHQQQPQPPQQQRQNSQHQQQPQQHQMPPQQQFQQQQQQQLGIGSPMNHNVRPGMMPPPPVPPGQPQMRPMPPGAGPGQPTFSLSLAQQQHFTNARNNVIASPQFQALPPQQQQHHLGQMQQQMMRQFAAQNGQLNQPGQQPPPHQMPMQQQSPVQVGTPQTPHDPSQGMPPPQQSPSMSRQSIPGQQPPLSSLPQHMHPPRPGSAASQRANSPHPSQGQPPPHMASPIIGGSPAMGTPPPSSQMYHAPTPSAPSPAASVHSQHSHHTPTHPQQNMPPSSASPMSMHIGTPQQGHYQQVGQAPTPQRAPSATPSIPQQGTPMQQHAQNAQQMLHSGQLGNLPQPPPHGLPMNMAQLSQQQQQQLGSAMNIFNSAAAHQGGMGRPPMTPQPPPQHQQQPGPAPIRPPDVDTSDFPFDWRILPQIHRLQDPQWSAMMQNQNPQLFGMMQSAANMLATSQIPPQMFQRMQAMINWQRQAQNQQMGGPGQGQMPRPPILQQPQPMPPSFGRPPPPAHQPPPMRPPTQANESGSPGHGDMPHAQRRSSGKDRGLSRDGTPSQGMPPPAWIPAHGTPVRPGAEGHPSHPPPQNALPVKEWEGHVRLDLPITHITSLGDEGSDPTFQGKLPALTDQEKEDMRQWIDSDLAYAKQIEGVRTGRVKEKMIKWAKNNDMDTPWWSLRKGERRPQPSGRLTIVWPQQKADRRARTSHRGRKEIRFSAAQLKSMAMVEDQVVPVRLDLEHDHWKLKDTFMWNCSDTVVTPELFAQSLCDDFSVPPQHFIPRIVAAIKERVKEYQDQVLPLLVRSPDLVKGVLDPEGDEDSKRMYEIFRRAREASESDEILTESGADEEGDDRVRIVEADGDVKDIQAIDIDDHEFGKDTDKPMSVEEAMAVSGKESQEDLRILIRVDIIVGTQNLTDTFEWDLNSTVTPEDFAALHCKELGLSGEFATALAHDIHEQVLVHKRSLFLIGHTPGSGFIQDDEVRAAFLPPVVHDSVVRREELAMAGYTPIFATYSEQEIVDIETLRERENKRKKRGARARRGVVLPDREHVKTHRTLVNPIGPNGVPLPTADPIPAAQTGSSRRAAAIAAQANINLLAQDLPIPQPASPPSAPHPGPRRGRPPGSYKKRPSPGLHHEGSIIAENPQYPFQQHDMLSTPSVIGKRGLREDSISETVIGGSPLPPHKRRNGGRVIESPDDDDDETAFGGSHVNVGRPDIDIEREKLEDASRAQWDSGSWHCKQCGVSQELSGGTRNHPRTGYKSMCATCTRHLSRVGKDRNVEYIEDDEFHRQRIEANRRKPHSGASSGLPLPPSAPHTTASSVYDREASVSSGAPGSAHFGVTPLPTSLPPSTTIPTMQLAGVQPDEDDDDSSDSSDDDSDDDYGKPKKKKRGLGSQPTPVRSAQTPVRTVSASGAITSPGTTVKKASEPMPYWITHAHSALKEQYPLDEFTVIPKAKPADQPHAPQEWRIKCQDCPGKVYTLGPGESLSNFEVHLKNRSHVERRQSRVG